MIIVSHYQGSCGPGSKQKNPPKSTDRLFLIQTTVWWLHIMAGGADKHRAGKKLEGRKSYYCWHQRPNALTWTSFYIQVGIYSPASESFYFYFFYFLTSWITAGCNLVLFFRPPHIWQMYSWSDRYINFLLSLPFTFACVHVWGRLGMNVFNRQQGDNP